MRADREPRPGWALALRRRPRPSCTALSIVLVALASIASCSAPAATAPTAVALTATFLPSTPTFLSNQPSPASSAIPTLRPTPTATPHASATRQAASSPLPTAIPAAEGTPAPTLAATLITRTASLDIYRVEGGLTATTLLELAPQFEAAHGHVGARMGARLSGRVAISFEPPQIGPCALRGLTRSHERIIQLYYAPETPARLILPIVAHELAHELQHDYYGWEAHRRSDIILLEGQATWASGDYGRGGDGRPVWASEAEQALAEGTLLPLATDLERDCRRTTRNAAYTGWASFVDFLIAAYGRERFDTLYRSGRGHTPGSADYVGVYSKSLDELDQEWRKWLADR